MKKNISLFGLLLTLILSHVNVAMCDISEENYKATLMGQGVYYGNPASNLNDEAMRISIQTGMDYSNSVVAALSSGYEIIKKD